MITYIYSCDGCPFSGNAIEIDCWAERTLTMRKPNVRSVIRSAETGGPPPKLCPLRTLSITVRLGTIEEEPG